MIAPRLDAPTPVGERNRTPEGARDARPRLCPEKPVGIRGI